MPSQRRAWSPYKEKVVAYVRANPGCSKLDVARHVTRSPWRGPTRQYYIVNTAVRNGWILAFWAGGRYLLFTPDMVPPHFRADSPEQRELCQRRQPPPSWRGLADGRGLPEPEAAENV
jgi:hypothetical protein